MRRLYTVLLYLAAPFVILRLAWRGLRAPGYWRRWPERFGSITPAIGAQVVWFHAVSVGEVEAAAPVVRALLEERPELSLIITTTTPTGSARVTRLFGDTVAHAYAPYDLPGAVRRFLARVRPRLAVIMETELWPNLFHSCRQMQIPLLLVNARMSPRSAAGYRRVRSLTREVLDAVNTVAAQGPADAERFIALGVDPARVRVTGNLKFEQRLPASLLEEAAVLRREWGVARPVWIAASTHEGEEEPVLDAFARIREESRDCLLVLVPRHPERFLRVASLCRRRGYTVVMRTDHRPCTPGGDVFIGDTMGELPLFYAASDVAFVGGSLVPVGGHNLLEPASLGVPVVTGPHMTNFAEISHLLTKAGACRWIADPSELAVAVGAWLADANARFEAGERGRAVVEGNRGALQAVLLLMAPYL